MTRYRFMQWLAVWDGSIMGFEAMPYSYDSLTVHEATRLHAKLGERATFEATRCIMGAALRTMPASGHDPRALYRFYSHAQLLACCALRIYLGVGWGEWRTYLQQHPRERYLIFAKENRLPGAESLFNFAAKITPEQWRLFTQNLRLYNPNLAEIYTSIA